MILKCPKNCKDDYQDEKHKTGNRVYTEPGKGGKDDDKCRCTVCGYELTYAEAKKLA